MKSSSIIFAILTLAVLTVSLTAFARQVENWSYERLFKESDLVVIAQPVKSEDSADRTKDNPWEAEFSGINTMFNVEHALKGTLAAAKITVLHYKTDGGIQDGPSLVSFRTKGLSYTITKDGHAGVKVQTAGPATYLLFLKKRDDDRFEPTSGHIDPADSVRELRMPTPLNEEE